MLSLHAGNVVVKTARGAAECHLLGRTFPPLGKTSPGLEERQGVFVSLVDRMNGGGLRGCIGTPLADRPLLEQVMAAAVEAATMDMRFRPVGLEELGKLVVEVTILSPLEGFVVEKPLELREKVLVGRDGLVVDGVGSRGLLLPQVAVEEGFDTEEFLSQCCLKAGLPPDAWLTSEVKVSRFQGQVFAEERPNGPVFERILEPGAK
jgi:uncharacterized protein (TIGR00296 family)